MSCWAIIPIKGKGRGKSRLSDALSARERNSLIDAMLTHVVEAALQAPSIDRVCLVGPSRHGIDEAIPLFPDRGAGLNAALDEALAQMALDSPDRLIVVAGDLPYVTSLDLDLLASLPAGMIGIAPDRHGTGTNALSLPLPEAAGFAFHFGTDSRASHCSEAERLGLTVETIYSAGLEKDIDEPSDLADAVPVFSPAP